MSKGKQMTREQICAHLGAGGQFWKSVGNHKFYYKLQDGKLLCRVNDVGGWNNSMSSINQLTRDTLHVVEEADDVDKESLPDDETCIFDEEEYP